MVVDEDLDQILANTNNTGIVNKPLRYPLNSTTAIIELSKRVNDYQLSIIDRLSI